ncbi:hypothetical protein [Granulicella sp. dw_53]|uniref:hypothetical protein n=1 Tax=Granulicella sp. dw_53 TaxID=2719792 RepID=UPI001BD56307|nr:hypothetical protein [Granulicella sp. dw_53]
MAFNLYVRKAIKQFVFGGDILPTRFFIKQSNPQTEITVWLHGFGPPRDVTRCHAPASSVPCTFWIAFESSPGPNQNERTRLLLRFCENSGKKKMLGEIGLKWIKTIEVGKGEIQIFEPNSAANYCYPKFQIWTRSLLHTWRQQHSKASIKPSDLELRAMSVLFICPRPISLVSVQDDERANIFPLNIMSDLHDGYFAFALTAWKIPAMFLEHVRFFALSDTPIERGSTAFNLAINHNNFSIKWEELPFETKPSNTLGTPVPVFSPRIREMEIESVYRVGSHSIFIARTISDERLAEGPELSVVHGFYQAWRIRHGLDNISSIVEDANIRSGLSSNLSAFHRHL